MAVARSQEAPREISKAMGAEKGRARQRASYRGAKCRSRKQPEQGEPRVEEPSL